ncbi:MAG: 6-carboxytetrahydropterin synthase [candidate division NC10 bacterium]|nr:6-carboxytetrahydropterin synthase [candidate division NC10 bacterium]
MRITRRVEFCAAHAYRNSAWSDEENRRVFGKAANLHGHNYVLEVTVEGAPSPSTGMIMDLKALKDLVMEEAVERLDHRNLIADVPEFRQTIPTPENLAVWIWRQLQPRLTDCRLQRIRLCEDLSYWVDYLGEETTDA